MNHTKGPWVVYPETDGTEICADDLIPGLPVRQIICRMDRGDNWIANAHRIVACVNACEGIPTSVVVKSAEQGGLFKRIELISELYPAARALRDAKGRFHTELAMKELLLVLSNIEKS